MRPPGSSLLAVLARCLDANLLNSVVAPTVADLQHEAQSAESGWRRRLALARGYAAIGRVLLWHGLIWRFPMRRLLTVLVLGSGGAALLVEMFSVTTSGPAQISPFFLMAVLAPIVMRYGNAESSRRQMFVNCMGVGTLMSVVLLGWLALMSRAPWYAYAPGLLFLLGCVALTSAMIAIVVATPAAEDKRANRGILLDVIASAITFGVGYSLMSFLRLHPVGGMGVLDTVSWGVFLGFFFVLVSIGIYLPILMSARRVLQQGSRVPLAILGALLFPIPMLAFPLLQGRVEAVAAVLLRDPVALLSMALPYILAGATLGWLTAMPRFDVRRSV